MKVLTDNNYLVTELRDLDRIPMFDLLFMDFETESRDIGLMSVDPWHNCWPLGVAVTGDDYEGHWYVPWEFAKEWLPRVLNRARFWINHNIKYDAHVLLNNGIKLPKKLQLVCTIAMAHLIHADLQFQGGYDLDNLAKLWLPEEYRKTGDTLARYLHGNKDYGRIPTDILAEYANNDVLVNRQLWAYMTSELTEDRWKLHQNEIELTRVLLNMERVGLHIDPTKVAVQELVNGKRMLDIEEKIEEKLGYPINTRSPLQIYDLVCNVFGMPVLTWTNADSDGEATEDSNASFVKETLKAYKLEKSCPKKLSELIDLMLQYREYAQHNSLFYEPWQKLHVDGVLHPSYNQNLRTGRLSCRQPNSQQLDEEAKRHISPAPGCCFLSFDYSQIEYRIIIHYIGNERIIQAYRDNPDIDYHQLMADDCGVTRRQGKTLNFSLAFGQGKKKTTAALAEGFRNQGESVTWEESIARANTAFSNYHRALPELRRVSKYAEIQATKNGYVRNLAGRHLHLPGPYHNIAFSKKGEKIDRTHIALCGRAVQATAADIQKFKAVELQDVLEVVGGSLVALVHDEFLIQIPDGDEHSILSKASAIRAVLEAPIFELDVPLRVDGGYSRKTWADCKNQEIPRGTPSPGYAQTPQ